MEMLFSMAKRKMTIDDIAHAVNVSKTTISRYLNGKYEYMSQETKERIKRAIEETNYRPNKLASSLKSNHSRQIGLLIADICNPISAILVRGVSDVCSNLGFSLVIYCTDSKLEIERSNVEDLLDQQVDGIIVNPADYSKSSATFENREIPFVMIDRMVESGLFDSVVTDSYEATTAATRHLYRQGFRNIALFSENPEGVSTRLQRISAFTNFYYETFSKDPKDAIYIIDANDPEQTRQKISDLLAKSNGDVPAIFTVNGVCMIHVLSVIHQMKLEIPDDIALCGYDNWDWTHLTTPGITVISQPSYDVGALAAKRLIAKISQAQDWKNTPPVCETLNSKLIIRGSTDYKKQ